jgi:hypothetical protein
MCIGMQKAGTDWLYDQLLYHPDFWMPPIKEFHYLDREESPKIGRAKTLLELKPRRLKKRFTKRKPWNETDYAFLQEAAALEGPLDLKRYANLFRYKGDLLSGDVTPGYSAIGEDMISEVDEALPGLKIILLVRDPVARAWSQISMAHRNDNFDGSILAEPQRLRDFLKDSKLVGDRGFPTQIAQRWLRAGPHLNLRWFFFDDIEQRAEAVRSDILTFLGANPEKKSGDLEASFNRKSKMKLMLTDERRAVLVEHFADELFACAEMFGGPAALWPAKYGLTSAPHASRSEAAATSATPS